jgi:antitoxin CptB
MTNKIDDLKKKIIYRSNYRGTKEMDSLMGSFTKKYINKLNYSELINLSELLDVDDDNLYKFQQGHKISIIIENNKVTQLFKNFIYKKD